MSVETREIVDLFDAGPHHAAALCTLVELSGSGYRRPGARLLVTRDADGRVSRAGCISGGCLESDLARHAFNLCRDAATVVAYDTREEAPVPAGFDTGCEGIAHVLVERATEEILSPLRTALTGSAEPYALVYDCLGLGARPGQRFTGATAPDWLGQLPADLDRPVSRVIRRAEGVARVLIDPAHPPRTLYVFGDGEDARPLVSLAATLGYRVVLCGKRPALAARERFPEASRIVCGGPAEQLARIELTPRSAAILLTHDLHDDADLLPALISSSCGYVGVLGPRRRAARLMQRLHELRRLPDVERLTKLHSPAGHDLGGDGPAAVALSVLSEIEAFFNGHPGGPLRQRPGSIHA